MSFSLKREEENTIQKRLVALRRCVCFVDLNKCYCGAMHISVMLLIGVVLSHSFYSIRDYMCVVCAVDFSLRRMRLSAKSLSYSYSYLTIYFYFVVVFFFFFFFAGTCERTVLFCVSSSQISSSFYSCNGKKEKKKKKE